jgi:type II secretory pathway pseudopilin PulG
VLAEKIKRRNKDRQSGFIVVELIVVIIIVALLLAILVPKVVQYINSAKADYEMSEARTVVTALQVINTITYEHADLETNDPGLYDRTDVYNMTLTKKGHQEVEDLASMEIGKIDQIVFEDSGQLKSLRYFTIDGSIVYYDSSHYTVDLQ